MGVSAAAGDLRPAILDTHAGGCGSLWWRVGERAAALVLALLSLPVVLLAAAIIWGLSRRTPFVTHRRIGQFGKPFWMWKLRTMWGLGQHRGDACWVERIGDSDVPLHKHLGDPRVTSRFAQSCRRYSIDELPQLWHVLSGRMALVGPRPLTARELDLHYGPAAVEILRLKPGITGLWQVRGRNRLTYRQRRRLDRFLARHYSPGLACLILVGTLPAVLSGHDAA